MPLYFFHLRSAWDDAIDPDGVMLPASAMANTALLAARDCMAADVLAGQLRLQYRIDVQDEEGKIVHTLHFADAVEIVPA